MINKNEHSNRYLLSCVGFAIIIGIIVGMSFPTVKYYFLSPRFETKREITKKSYEDYQTKKQYFNNDTYAKYSLVEEKFNTEYAIIYGSLTFGLLLFINGVGLFHLFRTIFIFGNKTKIKCDERLKDELATSIAKWYEKNADDASSVNEMLDSHNLTELNFKSYVLEKFDKITEGDFLILKQRYDEDFKKHWTHSNNPPKYGIISMDEFKKRLINSTPEFFKKYGEI